MSGIFDPNIFDSNIFDTGDASPVVVAALDSGAGSGKAKKTDFWWELSTISFLARAARRKRKTPVETQVPEVKPAEVVFGEPVEIVVDETLQDEIRAVIFQANAEIANLQAQGRKDAANSALINEQIERIKKELMRIREEEDILLIAMMD